MPMEIWREIDEFPGYSISSRGRVMNDDTDRLLALTRNQNGIVQVGLMRDGTQYKRSVAVLVANAFLSDADRPETFDTPINLDGDRMNNTVENLMWRPRHFAIKYHRQFKTDHILLKMTIEDEKTGTRYRNSRAAAMDNGLLERDVETAVNNGSYVWPTYQTFRVIDERARGGRGERLSYRR